MRKREREERDGRVNSQRDLNLDGLSDQVLDLSKHVKLVLLLDSLGI